MTVWQPFANSQDDHTYKFPKTVPVSSLIGGKYVESFPVLSPDGQMLYFTRAGHPNNVGGIGDPGDIWCRRKRFNGSWGEAFHLNRSVNTSDFNRVVGMDANSAILYVNNAYDSEDTLHATVYYSEHRNGLFTAPHKVSIPGLEKYAYDQSLTASSAGDYFILSLRPKKGQIAENLHISHKVDGVYTEPIRMDEEINSREQEICPYFINESTLLFCSNGLAGYGNQDAYITLRKTLDWKEFTLPYNLGPKFNSPQDEIQVSITENMDVVYIQKSVDNGNFLARAQKGKPEEYEIHGNVKDQKGKALSAKVEFHDFEDYTNEIHFSTNSLGRLSAKINIRTSIKCLAYSSGYMPQIQLIPAASLQNETPTEVDFTLQKIVLGQTLPLSDVHFSEDGRDMTQSSHLQLEIIAETLQQNPELKAIISLYSYHSDNANENKKIGNTEVKLLQKILEAKGANPSKMLFVPNYNLPSNKYHPVSSDTPYGSFVEIVFIKN